MLHPKEIEILNILWSTNNALSYHDIASNLPLSHSPTQYILRKFLNHQLVEVTSMVHSQNVLTRLYRPTQKAKELVLQQYVDSYNDIKNIVSIEEYISLLREKYSQSKL